MNGASASTAVAKIRITPKTHRNTASGTSQRLLDSPRHKPLTVGADRIVNTLAAIQLFKQDTIVVDFGTATTFDCITNDKGGRFIGGVIMPGLRTASDELVRKTAKLPATELVPPTRAIGRRTEDCIRVGVLWGTADAVDGLVRRLKAEWPSKQAPKVVATGVLAVLVAPLCKEIQSV